MKLWIRHPSRAPVRALRRRRALLRPRGGTGALGGVLAALVITALPPGSRGLSAAQPAPQATPLPEAPARYDDDLLAPEFHRGRRAAVLEALPEDAVAVLLSAPERRRENDVLYEYRQDSDLYYLTGAHEPGTALAIAPAGIDVDGERVTELLFVPPRDSDAEVWTGRRLGPDMAMRELAVEKAVSYERFDQILGTALARRRLYHLPLAEGIPEGSTLAAQADFLRQRGRILELPPGPEAGVIRRLLAAESEEEMAALRRAAGWAVSRLAGDGGAEAERAREIAAAFLAAGTAVEWRSWREAELDGQADGGRLRARLDQLRAVKTPEELALLRRAIGITDEAHREAMRAVEPGMHEYEVEAVVEYVFRLGGAEHPGFPSIIGSGENSVILHHERNRRRMEAGDVVVIDVGAEYHGYSADVTRTIPVSGVFSPEQRAIYELVLRAQREAIAAARAGSSFSAPHRAAQRVLLEGMLRLGLVRDEEELERFFMHGTSHYLGLWVHDVGSYGALEPGNVITVEPGIYIAPAADVDPKWWNIGVRIEDDVLITAEGPVVLSAAPSEPDEIEALMQEPPRRVLPALDGDR